MWPTILWPCTEDCPIFSPAIFMGSICHWHSIPHASHSRSCVKCCQKLAKSVHVYHLNIPVGWEFPELDKMVPRLPGRTGIQSRNLLGLASLNKVTRWGRTSKFMWLLETVSCWLLYWLTNFLLAVGLDQPQLLVSKPSHHGCLLPKSQKGSEFSRTIGVDGTVTEAISYLSRIPLFRQVTDHSHTLGNGCGYQVVGMRELCKGLLNVTYCLLSLFHHDQLSGAWVVNFMLIAASFLCIR